MAIFAGNWHDESGAPFALGAYTSPTPEAPQRAIGYKAPVQHSYRRWRFAKACRINADAWNHELTEDDRLTWWEDAVYGITDRLDSKFTPKQTCGRYACFNLRNFRASYHWGFNDVTRTFTPTAFPISLRPDWYYRPENLMYFRFWFDQPIWEAKHHVCEFWLFRRTDFDHPHAPTHAKLLYHFSDWPEWQYQTTVDFPLDQDYPVGTWLRFWLRWKTSGQVYNFGRYWFQLET